MYNVAKKLLDFIKLAEIIQVYVYACLKNCDIDECENISGLVLIGGKCFQIAVADTQKQIEYSNWLYLKML